jgi:hypothetical protein
MRLNYIETLSFSVFHSDKGIFETNPKINNISFTRLLEIYQSPFVKEKTLELRKAILNGTPTEQRALKNKLPFYTTNGSFTERNNASISQHNENLIALDIDGLTELEAIQVKEILSKHESTLLAAISPRLKGVKALILIENKLLASLRYTTLKTNKREIAEALNILEFESNIDKAQFVLSQPCFISYDESLYFNLDAQPLKIEFKIEEPKHFETNFTKPPSTANKRIETYLLNATKVLCDQLEVTAEGNRHFSIKKISAVCSWLHYAPNLKPYILECFYNSIVKMYGGEKPTIQQGGLRAYRNAIEVQEARNNTIESIINEIIAA